MCGIFGRICSEHVAPSIVEALRGLDYRGYDSAGLACISKSGIEVRKCVGNAQALAEFVAQRGVSESSIGIGHTRWATHGGVTESNAHPHLSMDTKVAVVHNGTIENYAKLRDELMLEGYVFQSQTDTEVIPNLIQRELAMGAASLEDAVASAAAILQGAYAIAVICVDHPNEIVAARNSSPLVAGIGIHGDLLLSSDETVIARHARSILRLGDTEIITLSLTQGLVPRGQRAGEIAARLHAPDTHADVLSLGTFATRMEQEIYAQPSALIETIRGRVDVVRHEVRLGGLASVEARMKDSRGITIVACGTSMYAGLAGARVIEAIARVPTRVVEASEFPYSDPILGHSDIVIGVSQSGETMDVIKALELAIRRDALVLAINNTVGSAIARMVTAGVYLRVGPEYAVASTKAFSAQVIVFAMIAALLAKSRTGVEMVSVPVWRLIDALACVPACMRAALLVRDQVVALAQKYQNAPRIIFLGKGSGVPLALEGSLKIKELAYMDTHAYGAGELKHGPLALIEPHVPVVCFVPHDEVLRSKMLNSMHEVLSRGGDVIAVSSDDPASLMSVSTTQVGMPFVSDLLMPAVWAPFVQFFALELAIARGCNVDQPRNLAKSVTVE